MPPHNITNSNTECWCVSPHPGLSWSAWALDLCVHRQRPQVALGHIFHMSLIYHPMPKTIASYLPQFGGLLCQEGEPSTDHDVIQALRWKFYRSFWNNSSDCISHIFKWLLSRLRIEKKSLISFVVKLLCKLLLFCLCCILLLPTTCSSLSEPLTNAQTHPSCVCESIPVIMC